MLNVNSYVYCSFNIHFKIPNHHLSPFPACFYTLAYHKLALAIQVCIREGICRCLKTVSDGNPDLIARHINRRYSQYYSTPQKLVPHGTYPYRSGVKKTANYVICAVLKFSKIERILLLLKHLTHLTHLTHLNSGHFISFC
jgi:hypothetical protein